MWEDGRIEEGRGRGRGEGMGRRRMRRRKMVMMRRRGRIRRMRRRRIRRRMKMRRRKKREKKKKRRKRRRMRMSKRRGTSEKQGGRTPPRRRPDRANLISQHLRAASIPPRVLPPSSSRITRGLYEYLYRPWYH